MDNVIQTPNEIAQPPEAPHLTEAEMKQIRIIQQFREKMNRRMEWNMFQRIAVKPEKYSKPTTFNENGEVVVCEGKQAPISSGNLQKGTLRNKKCSCGSGKKFKKCCLLKQNS